MPDTSTALPTLSDLWASVQRLRAALGIASAASTALRGGLIADHGAPAGTKSAADLWQHDPRYSKLCELLAVEAQGRENLMLTERAILVSPATDLAGLKAKAELAMLYIPAAIEVDVSQFWHILAASVVHDLHAMPSD